VAGELDRGVVGIECDVEGSPPGRPLIMNAGRLTGFSPHNHVIVGWLYLIPLNSTPGSKWDASPKPAQDEFVRRVNAQGVPCTVRDTRGREIAAARGWLATFSGTFRS